MSYFKDTYGGDGEDDDNNSDDESSKTTTLIEEAEEEVEVDVDEDDDVDVDDDDDDDVDIDVDEKDIEDDDVTIGGGADSDNDLEEGEFDVETEAKTKRTKKIPAKTVYKTPDIDDDDDDDDDDGEMYLQKFDQSVNDNYIVDFHPESVLQNYDEILAMIRVIRDKDGIIVDDLHRTIPYLTKYEKARILGQRAKQINAGATPFVKVPENVIDGYIIAEIELKEKRIPFIIRRPLPNGGSEYWSIKDLEDISF